MSIYVYIYLYISIYISIYISKKECNVLPFFLQKNGTFSRSFPFFSKERYVLRVLFRSFKKNGTFFAFFFSSFCLHKSYKHCKSRKKERKKNVPFFLKNVPFFFRYTVQWAPKVYPFFPKIANF